MIDVSVFMPAIRTQNWKPMYESLKLSCKKYSFELVLCSPFDLPTELQGKSDIKLIKDFGSPSRCAQLASFECEGRLLYHCVDDALFLEDAIDLAIERYDTLNKVQDKVIINMKYREGQGYSGQSMRPTYWMAWGHDALCLPGIQRNWKISLHHLIDAKYFRELGGYNCEYEYQNFNLHDLIFRAQIDGAYVENSPTDVTTCDHSQADHKVIEDAHAQHDAPLFFKKYSIPNNSLPIKIDLNNWTQQPSVWPRRFKGNETKYEELVK